MKIIYELNSPLRINKYLVELDKESLYSRSFIDKLISNGKITVNGQEVKKSHLLNRGDVIEIVIPPSPESQIKGEPIPLEVIYEDEYLAIINKPPGISVHPAPGQSSGTIANAIINRFGKNLPYMDNPTRPGIVHRLDKQTSGLLIIARDDKTLSRLNKAFSDRKIRKYYQAILLGIPGDLEGTIKTLINRNRKERTKMTVSQTGKESETRFRILKTFEFFSHADVMPITGRTHQIRVHFDHINCPIAGDATYGKKKGLSHLPVHLRKRINAGLEKRLPRQALHAYRLKFKHPVTNDEIDLEIELPEDMQNVLDWLATEFESYEPQWENPFA